MTRRTPLYPEHQKLHARFTEFGGWDMPVQYSSIMDEHTAVRTRAGLFDTSHMGTLIVAGPESTAFLNRMTVADVPALVPGQAKYSLFLNDGAGIVDDLIIYRRTDDYLLVVNAGNKDKDIGWLRKHLTSGVTLEDISDRICMLALQGPDTEKVLQPLVKESLAGIRYFTFFTPAFTFAQPAFAMAARTGYTGEDGFELLVSCDTAPALWEKLIAAGVKPAGLGARDTLRLEAAMPLHGHEINDDITPLEAGLGWVVSWGKDFIGKKALQEQKENGIRKFLVAFMLDSGIPRAHCDILVKDEKAGTVVSGTYSPTLKKGIGMGYVASPLAEGETISVIVHGQPKTGRIVKKPFYKRSPRRST